MLESELILAKSFLRQRVPTFSFWFENSFQFNTGALPSFDNEKTTFCSLTSLQCFTNGLCAPYCMLNSLYVLLQKTHTWKTFKQGAFTLIFSLDSKLLFWAPLMDSSFENLGVLEWEQSISSPYLSEHMSSEAIPLHLMLYEFLLCSKVSALCEKDKFLLNHAFFINW